MVNLYEKILSKPLEIRTRYQGIKNGTPKFIGEKKNY